MSTRAAAADLTAYYGATYLAVSAVAALPLHRVDQRHPLAVEMLAENLLRSKARALLDRMQTGCYAMQPSRDTVAAAWEKAAADCGRTCDKARAKARRADNHREHQPSLLDPPPQDALAI